MADIFTDQKMMELMQRALDSANGISVSTSDPSLFRNRFYGIRKACPEFSQLSARTSPRGRNEVWLVKQGVKDNGAPKSETY